MHKPQEEEPIIRFIINVQEIGNSLKKGKLAVNRLMTVKSLSDENKNNCKILR
jgi:hypothetical protein